MSNRLAVALAVALLFTSACTGSRAAIVAGAGTMLLGGMAYAAGAPNNNCTYSNPCGGVDSFFDGIGDDINEGTRDLGAGMVITGALIFVAGLVANAHTSSDDDDDKVRVVATSRVRAPTIDVVFTEPEAELAAPGTLASPAELAVRARIQNRLWIQARVAAARGDCIAATATAKRLAEVDPPLHAELMRTNVDVALCVELAAERATR